MLIRILEGLLGVLLQPIGSFTASKSRERAFKLPLHREKQQIDIEKQQRVVNVAVLKEGKNVIVFFVSSFKRRESSIYKGFERLKNRNSYTKNRITYTKKQKFLHERSYSGMLRGQRKP